MKITPFNPSSQGMVTNPAAEGQSQVQDYKRIRLAVNHTPGPREYAPQQPLQTIPANNETSEAVVEATQPLSPQLALLAKQRRVFLQQQKEFEARQKEFQSRSTSEMVELSRLKAEPLKVLLDNGVTYDDLTKAILANQQDPGLRTIEQKLEELNKRVDQRFTENTTQQEQMILAEMQKEASHIVQNSDDFEFVRETKSIPKVIKLIKRIHEEEGEILDLPEALRLVEDELFKDYQRVASLKKMQAMFQPAPAPQQRQYGNIRTLTNRDTASVPMTAKARAMAVFNGTLKRS